MHMSGANVRWGEEAMPPAGACRAPGCLSQAPGVLAAGQRSQIISQLLCGLLQAPRGSWVELQRVQAAQQQRGQGVHLLSSGHGCPRRAGGCGQRQEACTEGGLSTKCRMSLRHT